MESDKKTFKYEIGKFYTGNSSYDYHYEPFMFKVVSIVADTLDIAVKNSRGRWYLTSVFMKSLENVQVLPELFEDVYTDLEIEDRPMGSG